MKKYLVLILLVATTLACAPTSLDIIGFTMSNGNDCDSVMVQYEVVTAPNPTETSPFVVLRASDNQFLGQAFGPTGSVGVFTLQIPITPVANGEQVYVQVGGIDSIGDPVIVTSSTASCSATDFKDTDLDGVPDVTDNCPTVYNSDQANSEGSASGNACEVVYNVGLGVVGFPLESGWFSLWGGCVGNVCSKLAEFDPGSFTPNSMPKQLQLSGVYYQVTAYYLGVFDQDGLVDVYQVNVVGPEGLVDDHLLFLVYADSTWRFQERDGSIEFNQSVPAY